MQFYDENNIAFHIFVIIIGIYVHIYFSRCIFIFELLKIEKLQKNRQNNAE